MAQSRGDLGPGDARALLRAWLVSMDLDIDEGNLLELLQEGELSHPDLERRRAADPRAQARGRGARDRGDDQSRRRGA